MRGSPNPEFAAKTTLQATLLDLHLLLSACSVNGTPWKMPKFSYGMGGECATSYLRSVATSRGPKVFDEPDEPDAETIAAQCETTVVGRAKAAELKSKVANSNAGHHRTRFRGDPSCLFPRIMSLKSDAMQQASVGAVLHSKTMG